MKKLIILAFLPLLFVAGCKKDLTSINVNPKAPRVAPAGAFFTSAQKEMVDLLTSTNVNDNTFRLIMQYWQETTYTDESNYDIVTRQNPRQLWNGLYRDVIQDLREAKNLYNTQTADAATKQNQLAQVEILEVMAWYYLVTTFGDIPYTEALNIDITLPKYDNQQEIYNNLLTRLDAAIGQLNPASAGIGTADQFYGGDIASWKVMANTFKVKMGMTIVDADPARARTAVESAVTSGVMTSNAQNATFKYQSAPPNNNPVWADLVQSGRNDFVAASTIVTRMVSLSDPRLPFYFTTDANGAYSGGRPGASSSYQNLSQPSGLKRILEKNNSDIGNVASPDAPAVVVSYDELEFFLAEAAQRGFTVGGTAAAHYNAAVTASILLWGGTQAQATAYLAQPGVAYAAATYKQRIGEQKWIALYNRGWDAWIEWRRLDAPAIVAPATAVSATPLRFTYPIPEQNLNIASYAAAATAIGGDEVTTKLFWDKF